MILGLFLGVLAFFLACALLRLELIWFMFCCAVSILVAVITIVGFTLSYFWSRLAQCLRKSTSLSKIKPGDGYVLVTGASSGIGKEMALEFLERGFHVIGVGFRSREALENMKKTHRRFDFIVADLSTNEGISKVINNAKNVSILINNAGISDAGRFQKNQVPKPDGWDKVDTMMGLNMRSYVKLTQAFLPAMVEKRSGRILAMGSIAGYTIGPNNALYHGSKAFVNNFFTSLWYDLQGTGVGVTLGSPGSVATHLLDAGPKSFLWQIPGLVGTAKGVAKAMVGATIAGKKRESGSLLWNFVSLLAKLQPEFFNATLCSLSWSEKIVLHSLQPDLDALHGH